MTLDDAMAELAVALDIKTLVLVSEIKRLIVDLPFSMDSGFSKTSVDGIHFQYDALSFLPVACPLNTSTGYCGSAEPLALLSQYEAELLPLSLEEDVLDAVAESDREAVRDRLDAIMTESYCDWFASGWQLARSVSPRMRGFLSVHDTIWRTDLDTGEEFREDHGPIVFFPRKPR
jgi:hypothetical protein